MKHLNNKTSSLKTNDKGWSIALFKDQNAIQHCLCRYCGAVCCDAVELGCDHDDDSIYLFCDNCLNDLINENDNHCPIDQHLYPIIHSNRTLRRQILESGVYCPYSMKFEYQNNNNNDHQVGQVIDTMSHDEKEGIPSDHNVHQTNPCEWNGSLRELINSNHLTECNEHLTGNMEISGIETCIDLQNRFPMIDKNTIENIHQECNRNINQTIVILMQLDECMKVQQQPKQQNPKVAACISSKETFLPKQDRDNVVELVANQNISHPVQAANPLRELKKELDTHSVADDDDKKEEKHDQRSLNLDIDFCVCSCCGQCCPACYMVPDKYQNGLYTVDLRIKNVSLFLFVIMTIWAEYHLEILHLSNNANLITTIGLMFILIGSLLCFCSKSRATSTFNKVIAFFYFFGGFLYFIGYFIYSTTVKSYSICDHGSVCYCLSYNHSYDYSKYDPKYYCDIDCESDTYTYSNGVYSNGVDKCAKSADEGYPYQAGLYVYPQYFVMRGLFVFYNCIVMGMHYLSNTPKCFNNRLSFLRIESFLFGLLYILVYGWAYAPWTPWFIDQDHMAFLPDGGCFLLIALLFFINICIAQTHTSLGGCNSFSITGTLLFVLCFIQTVLFLFWTILVYVGLTSRYVMQPEIFDTSYLLWVISIVPFTILNITVYFRMAHPGLVKCCICKPQKDIIGI